MKTFLSIAGAILGGILIIVLLVSLAFGAEWLGIKWKGFFGPKHANVEREIFLETRSFNSGVAQQLAKYRHEYMATDDPDEKEAIKSTVRTMFAEVNPENIDNLELRQFFNTCMGY